MRNFMPRRALVLGILFGLAAAPAPAQARIGLKGGISYSTLSNASPDFGTRTGFAAGLSFDLGSGLLSLQPEALYVQKGTDDAGTPSATAPKLSYAEVPVLLKLTLGPSSLQPMAYAGPSVAFRLSCRTGESDCAAGTFKSTDWGAVLGAGLRVGGRSGFTIEGRYNWGLKDIHDIGAGVDTRTRTFLILAGVSL